MVSIPAVVWRGGPIRRGVTVGASIGLLLGALAWLDSGMLIAGVIVLVVVGIGSGFWTGRRMTQYWPGSHELSGAQREQVVAAARRGHHVGDGALAPAVVDYSRGLHAAAEKGERLRWVIVFVLVVAVVTALWDAVLGSWGNAVASLVYLVLVGLELFWWPKRRAELLANADRAAAMARQIGSAG
ncbi:hypothetical protein [Mycolicibacterium sp. YH-1]|uniref:hypothetical protein n=1 Tax=Mycolicibacterium sp. YH-1 TaxID=2908837 RepID=UPI001F4C1B13|nr:hypothetical protein [Mycolicibacterium sp. YH-1]UNB54061.1 hypothetical protein L0M16_06905 [Mycolicibacterium sp. YH-1]